jgi:hypothetical protein
MEHTELPWTTQRAALTLRWVHTPEGLRMRWSELASVPSNVHPIVDLGLPEREDPAPAA